MEDLRQTTDNEPERPYVPFIAAENLGLVNRDDLTPHELVEPLSAMLDSSKIPTEDAGLIKLGQDEWAVDHVVVLFAKRNELVLGPSSKDDVDSDGRFSAAGAITVTHLESGLISVIAEVIADNSSRWINASLGIGQAAARHIWPAQTFDPTNIDEGIIRARLWTP